MSTFIDIYLGNSTQPLNVDFSQLQHWAPRVQQKSTSALKELNYVFSALTLMVGNQAWNNITAAVCERNLLAAFMWPLANLVNVKWWLWKMTVKMVEFLCMCYIVGLWFYTLNLISLYDAVLVPCRSLTLTHATNTTTILYVSLNSLRRRSWSLWLVDHFAVSISTLYYKTIYSGQSKELQGPLWRKSHNSVRIWLPK